MKLIAIVLLLSTIQIARAPWGKFCSVLCGTSCSGELNTQCGQSCQSDGAWSSTNGSCITRPTWVYFNSTPDYNSGNLSINVGTTSTCNSVNYYGFVNTLTSITVSSNPILKPHYMMKMYVGIIALDVDCGNDWSSSGCGGGSCPTNSYWNTNTAFFSILFDDQMATETPATNPFSYKVTSGTRNRACYACRYRDYYTRASRLYVQHNSSSVGLQWTISTNQTTNTSALWGIRDFVIIIRTCHQACQQCWGPSVSQCYSCVTTGPIYWQSNFTCNQTCLYRFGKTAPDSYFCVYCDLKCTACYGVADNCSACTISGTYASYLSVTANLYYPTCVWPCSVGEFANTTARTCDSCFLPNCAQCIYSATYCTKCASGYFWTGWSCYSACPSGYFLDTNGANCTRCSPYCSECVSTNITCTACTLTGRYKSYLYNASSLIGSCQRICPVIPNTTVSYYGENFNNSGPNLCLQCSSNCSICTGNPSPCSKCVTGFFLYIDICTDSCPSGYFASTASGTGLCLNCDIYCVGLSINMYFPSVVNDKIYIDMQFTQDLNFTTFDWQNFQTINITSKSIKYTLDMFYTNYTQVSGSCYRIILEPKTYIFLYNATFTVTTVEQPVAQDYSIGQMPFKITNYLKTASLPWFLIKGPPFNTLEIGIMNSLSKLSTKTNNFLTKPYVQEIKKSGVFTLLFSGAAITSCSMLSNQIQSQNLYEGVRVFATFVFFDAPPYEKISDKTKRFVSPTVQDKIRNAQQVKEGEEREHQQNQIQVPSVPRSLFSTDNMHWRFQRTGQTSFFIYDVYVPMFLIALCWFGIFVISNAKAKRWYSAYAPHIYSAVHKIHEMSIMYVTMASIVEFIYFQPSSSDRIISAIVCVVFNVYFSCYYLYIYYDMIKYPLAQVGNKAYDYYVLRYGSFLRNVRYEEYDLNENWSPSHWFRPYNYHLLSYYKKFVMMISLPLFYSVNYAQMSVLFTLQCIEIIRLWKTWPYVSAKRNYFRLSLELALLFFFLVNLIQISVLKTIMSSDADGLAQSTKIFYGLGWVGFAACMYFNISFVCINIYDLCVGLRVSNRAKMDETRKKYYFHKISDYEKDNQASSKELVSKWVKLGNLNNRAYGQMPEVNVRIECYEFKRINGKYELSIKKITSLKMKEKSRLRRANNTTVGGKIQRKIILSPADNSRLYSVINDVYKMFEGPHVETIRLKTFLNVWQKDYKDDWQIPMIRNLMFQRVELISYDNEVTTRNLDSLIQDFPLNQTIINNAV